MPRVIYPPMSGRDRRFFAQELRRAEQHHAAVRERAAAAHATADRHLRLAHRLDCEEWSARQFIGGPAEPSPSIADAIHGGCEILEVECRHCKHASLVDLALLVWPRGKPVHSVSRVLYCKPCLADSGIKRRPNLVGLRTRSPDEPASPEAQRRSEGG